MANSEEEISLSELSLFQEVVQNVLVETKMTWRFSEKIQDLIFFCCQAFGRFKIVSVLHLCLLFKYFNFMFNFRSLELLKSVFNMGSGALPRIQETALPLS